LAKQQLSEQVTASPSLGLLIASAYRSIKHAAAPRLRRRRLSPQQFWLLVSLHERPGPSLRELAERRLMDSPTASRMVDLLVGRGLVVLEADPEDRRRRAVFLTARGSALVRGLDPLARQVRESIGSGLSDAEARALRRLLLRVVANMERLERRKAAPARPAAGRRRR
jgi:DNA-binding MarR family transcriptional regulator